MSLIKELLPEPDTPVIATNTPLGILTDKSLRLCKVACSILRKSVGVLLDLASKLIFSFDRYFPVTEVELLIIPWGVPEKTSSPPNFPALGPISIM